MTAPQTRETATADVVDLVDAEHPVLVRLRLEGTLRARVRTGVMWSAAFRVVLQCLTLGSQVVLARLLLPQDYGLVALALVFNGLAALVTELGLAAAVVQSRRVTDRLLSTAFWLNAISGVAVALLVFASAPLVALFYGEPRVVPLVQVSSLAFALNVSSVPSALLQRSLRFKTSGTLEVIGTMVGLTATVGAAAAGVGALSLVLGPLVQTVMMNVLVWGTVRWRPRGFMGKEELRQLWRFGGGLTGSNMLTFISRNADTVLLGRTVSAGDVGLYGRSYTMMMMPLAQVTSVLSKVLLPAFSEMQTDLPRFRRAWATTVRTSLFFGLPVGLGVAVTAPALVETLYGRRWLGMATTLTLLAASVPPQLIGRNLGPVFQALGRTGLQFRLALITSAVTVGAIMLGLPWGITGVALALLIKSWVALAIPLVPAMRLIGMPAVEMWRTARGALLAGVVLVAAALLARWPLADLPAPAVLLVQTLAGGVGYLLVMWFVERDLTRSALARVAERRRRRRR